MSTAKIVAKLVEAGHEDLAEELLMGGDKAEAAAPALDYKMIKELSHIFSNVVFGTFRDENIADLQRIKSKLPTVSMEIGGQYSKEVDEMRKVFLNAMLKFAPKVNWE